MRRRRSLLVSVMLAVALGGLVAVPFAPPRQVSLDVWIVVTTVWILFTVGSRLLDVAPLAPSRLQGPVRWRRETDDPRPRYPRDLVTLEGTLLRSTASPRMYDLQLRPRLQRVVAHALLHTDAGADFDVGPVADALGDLTWMVDQAVTDRAPTIDEVDQLLRRVSHEGSQLRG